MNKLHDFLIPASGDSLRFSKEIGKNYFFIRPDNWNINLPLPKANYTLETNGSLYYNCSTKQVNHYDLVFDLSKSIDAEYFEKDAGNDEVISGIKFGGGKLNIKHEFGTLVDYKNSFLLNNTFKHEINDLTDILSILKNIFSELVYDADINKTLTTDEFFLTKGRCGHFATLLNNILLNNNIKSRLVDDTFYNKIVDGKKYFKTMELNKKCGHMIVEFELDDKYFICDPTLWSTHLSKLNKKSTDYDNELGWLDKNALAEYQKCSMLKKPLRIVLKNEKDLNSNILNSDFDVLY